MKVAIIGPFCLPFIRGNSLSIHRLLSGLLERGVEAEAFCLPEYKNKRNVYRDIASFRPDVIHGFHAYKTGRIVQALKKRTGAPLIVSLRGTDFNIDLMDRRRRGVVVDTLRMADRIIVFAPITRDLILKEIPGLARKNIRVIPHAVKLENKKYNALDELGLEKNHFIFLVPAGIRRVKNVLFALRPLERLRRACPQIRLVYAGAVIDRRSGIRFVKKIRGYDWISYLGAVPHERMYSLYQASHVVVNSSLAEGMPNALLEAMSLGKPVLASRIPGNQAIIKDGKDGLLFEGEDDFEKKAGDLIGNSDLRKRLGEEAKKRIQRFHTPESECDRHIAIYEELCP
jgi:glycosyltransferase involved in cell wall biosynthesis